MTNATYTPPPFPCSIVVIQTTGQLGKTFKFERKDWCVLGANEDCDIIVPFSGVAQLQALVHVKHNGVFLQGIDKVLPVRYPRLQKKLVNEEEVLLHPGDEFFLGERKFLIEYSAEQASIGDANRASSAHESHASGITSKVPRNATPRSRRKQKKRRKSSLVVGEFDEKYVSPRNGSEKLLSKSQLARISQNEQDIVPVGAGGRNLNDRELNSPQEKSEHDLGDEDCVPHSPSSNESTVLSDPRDDVSRNIDFSTIENDLPAFECNWEQPGTGLTDTDRKVSSRERKELVFARLSKGLSATPRRGENCALIGRTDAVVLKASGSSLHEETTTLPGKENIPQLCDQRPKGAIPTDSKQDMGASRIRSPLSNRSELGNQLVPEVNLHRTPVSMRRILDAKLDKSSTQTPRGRSVAFASNIELAPGAHYSPFRPRQVTSAIKRPSKSEEKKIPGKAVGSARTHRRQGRFETGSHSHDRLEKTKVTKNYEQGPAPTSTLEGLGTFFYSREVSREVSHQPRQPHVEYEDDSNPPTPSSSEEGPETVVPQVPEVAASSPMARVGGALAGFLKRLSGTLESDGEDEFSQDKGDALLHKRQSFSKPQETSCVKSLSSSEPVMSCSEMKELSNCISPVIRKEFISQVESAAKDMHQAMHPVSEDDLTQDLLAKEDIDIMGLSVLAAEKSSEHTARECNTGYKDCKTFEAVDKQSCPSAGNPQAARTIVRSAGEYASTSESEEDGGSSSTSQGPCNSHAVVRDSADMKIEELFLDGTNDMNERALRSIVSDGAEIDYGGDYREDQTDLRSEVSEGDEIDYGDDYGDDCGEDGMSIASSGRGVAAVVVENVEDLVENSHVRGGKRSHWDDSQESERENSRELEKGNFVETEIAQSLPTAIVPDANSKLVIQGDSLGEERRNAGRPTERASAFTLDDVSQNVQGAIGPDVAAKNQISTETGKAEGVPAKRNETGSDTRKTDHNADPGGFSELEDKSTQIGTIRRELCRLKKDELKARLVVRELDTSGLKKDLVERLALHMIQEATPTEDGQSQENSALPQRIEETNAADTTMPALPCPQVTPRKLATQPRSAEVYSTAQETRKMVRRSARKSRTKSPSKMSVVEPSPPATSSFVAKPQMETEPETEVDLSSYRRRTVKELRQFLKDRGLDIQQKMRKEELIQHLVMLSIGSDGQDLPVVTESDVSAEKEANALQSSEPEQQSSSGMIKPQRMTVAQLRALLKERGQCQTGTKKTLLERLSSKPERRTRSRRAVDTTSCLSCQRGKICEADA